ncbi:MAG: nodulation protein NfeD [Ginsengibacter sp.]
MIPLLRINWISYYFKRSIYLVTLLLLLFPSLIFGQKVISIKVKDGINPAVAEFISQSIEKAEKGKAEVLIINLNTPGGLLSSTRDIVTDIMASEVPVVVYVSPSGAHAGSAGVFITLAANIAVMAPGTNIGAAHPVSMQGTGDAIMMEKGTNDAAAFIRSIAQKRGRNIQWAENAVRISESITEKEALEKNVINLIADSEADLMTKINGMKVELNSGSKTIQLNDPKVETLKMGMFQQVLSKISDPNIAYILMMLGFFGLMFELFSPGAIFPGIVGVICLILAFYAMSSMPVNYAGVALIVFGIILFLLEIKIVSHGVLAIGGIVSVLLGSMILFRSSPAENFVSLSWAVIFSVTAVSTAFFVFIITLGLKAQQAKPVSGGNTFIGKIAKTIVPLDPIGHVKILGETWKAESLSGKINENETVIIEDIKGLTLYVKSLPENSLHS